jgi:hypothetical protein
MLVNDEVVTSLRRGCLDPMTESGHVVHDFLFGYIVYFDSIHPTQCVEML